MDEIKELIESAKEQLKEDSLHFDFLNTERMTYPMEAILTFPSGHKIGIRADIIDDALYYLPSLSPCFEECTQEEKAHIPLLIGFWDEFVEIMDLTLSFAQKKWFEEHYAEKACSYIFKSFDYKEINHATASISKRHGLLSKIGDGWVKERKGNKIEELIQVFMTIKDSVHLYREIEPTLYLDSSRSKENNIPFYFEGYAGELTFMVDLDYYSFSEEGLCIQLETHSSSQIPETINQFFSEVKKKRRLKNLFEPPSDFYFRKALKSIKLSGEDKKIYSILSSRYDPRKIETLCAVQERDGRLFSIAKDRIRLFTVADLVFLDIPNQDMVIKPYTDLEEMMELYEKAVMEHTKNHIKKQIKLIPKKASI